MAKKLTSLIVLFLLSIVLYKSSRMKRTVLLCLLAVVSFISYSQSPVKWSYSSNKKDNQTYEVKITASINPGWHLYSQTTPDGGPVATKISFNKNPLLVMDGSPKEVGKM